jgi:hypothetical protein
MGMIYEDDDEAAVNDVAALQILDQLVSRAAEQELLRGEELAEAQWAVAHLWSLVEDWHGTARRNLLGKAPAGSA